MAKEWFQELTNRLFDPQLALFQHTETDHGCYQINPHSGINPLHLDYFRFAGRLIGKALFDFQLLQAHLSAPLYKLLLKVPLKLDDLALIDEQVYLSMVYMLKHPIKDIFFENFSVDMDSYGSKEVHELKPGGEKLAVTDANKAEYVELRLQWILHEQIRSQVEALHAGVYDVLPEEVLAVFDFQELELLVCGLPNIDVEDWVSNTVYKGDYSAESEVVGWFWEAVRGFSQDDRARLLQFTTGTSCVPVAGFGALQGPNRTPCRFTIESMDMSVSQLPRAHTCFNRLDLPKYGTKTELFRYLVLAIQMEATGFTMQEA